MRIWIARCLAALVFGPPILISHGFWWVWGFWAYLLGLIAGKEEQVRIWHMVAVGPTYSSTLLGPLWSYFGHEPEKRRMAAVAKDAALHCHVLLTHTEHEHSTVTFMRTETEPIYNARGAESFPLEDRIA